MKKIINFIIILQISVFGGIFSKDGLIKIKTWEGLDIYINNKFKGISGEGVTTIKLIEGQYKIKVSSDSIDGNWHYEAEKKIYIGEDMEIQTTIIPIKYPTKQYIKNEEQKYDKIKDYYNKHKSDFKKVINKYKVIELSVSTKKKGIALINEINKASNKKTKFVELLKRKSIRGLHMNWFSLDKMVPEFSNAVLKLKKGEYTHTPVKTVFGYHIIFLEDKILEKQLTLEESRKKIERILGLRK